MDAVSSCVSPLRSPPLLPLPPTSSASRFLHHRHRGSLTLSSSSSSSSIRLFSPPAAISARVRRPPSPLLLSRKRNKKPRSSRAASVVAFVQFNVAKALTTAWKVAKEGVEAGTNIVPDSVPRPIARICVAGVAATVAIFLLKSLLSTVLFVLAMMGLIYFTYIAFNAGEAPRAGGDTTTADEETLEEARRIMEKYK